MSNLKEHALRELRRAKLFDQDSDYNGMLGHSVMQLIEVFAQQGHSETSAMLTLALFKKVASFRTITGLTDDPAEWMNVAEDSPLYQSRRQSSCFSKDGGRTYHDIDEPLWWPGRAWRLLTGRYWPRSRRSFPCQP